MADIERKRMLTRRRGLRISSSIAEGLLWGKLRRKQLGLKFRRQHSIGKYIVDFYCHDASLVVEIDGQQHNSSERQEYDKERDGYIEGLGNKVVRFSAWEVCGSLDGVCLEILKCCGERSKEAPP